MDARESSSTRSEVSRLLDEMNAVGQPIIVERNGAAAAALVPIDLLIEAGLLENADRPAVEKSIAQDKQDGAAGGSLLTALDASPAETPTPPMIVLSDGSTYSQETILRTALEMGSVGAWIWDSDTDELVYCSDELGSLFDMSSNEFIACCGTIERMRSRIHPDDLHRYRAHARTALQANREYSADFRMRAPDNEYRDIREAGRALNGTRTPGRYVVGILQDVTQTRQIERAFLQSDEDLKRAQAQAKIGSWRWNLAENRLQSCSGEYIRMTGMTVNPDTGAPDVDSGWEMHPDDMGRAESVRARARKSGTPYRLEFRMIQPGGEVRHFVEQGEPECDETGKQLAQTGILRDVTERVRMEHALIRSHEQLERRVRERTEELAQSEARYRAIFEGAAAGIGRVNYRDGRILLSNERLASMFGYDCVDEFVSGFVVQDHYIETDYGRRLYDAYTSNPDKPLEGSFLRKDGSVVTVQMHAMIDHEQDLIDFICIDITDKKATELALAESERRLQSLLNNSPNLISIKDAEGRFVFLNRRYQELYGLGTEDVLGLTQHELFPQDLVERVALHESEVMQRRAAVTKEGRGGSAKHGGQRDFICCKFPLFDGSGEITGIASIWTDITDKRATERKLEQAQKLQAIGQLTGGIAHDFNNLLAVIRVNAELLQQQFGTQNRSISALLRATGSASELVAQLLSFARQQSLHPEATKIGTFVEGLMELVERNMGPGIEIETRIAPDLKPAFVDPTALETALLNLTFNARDAMAEGGRLLIECSLGPIDDSAVPSAGNEQDYVIIAVRDNGAGMSQDTLALACEPFYTTKDVSRGSGLGLSMVYGFAQQSNGHLQIESTEGAGTSVMLYLPVASRVTALKQQTAPVQNEPKTSPLILLVEDDGDLRTALTRMLVNRGCEVVAVADAAEARKTLRGASTIDLILTDIMLPGGETGAELLVDIRRSCPDMGAVLMTGYSTESARLSGILGGEVEVLKKPFHGGQLEAAIENALRGDLRDAVRKIA